MKILNWNLILFFSFGLLWGPNMGLMAQELPPEMHQQDYAFGADLSFLKQIEDENGLVFSDNGEAKPGLEIFRDNGYNWIRLRLWHSPDRSTNDLEYTIELAQEAKELGFKILLCPHYSDSWADPHQQWPPAAWEGMSQEEMVTALYEYNRDVITRMREAGVLPDMVQIGNEIGNGMLWPNGRFPENKDQLAELIYAGVNGVDAGRGNHKRPEIMIHIDDGGNIQSTKAFFDNIEKHEIPYDVMGFSFYPWSHGTLLNLRQNLTFAANEYEKDVILVETGFYWRQSNYFSEAEPPFPETPEGQKEFLQRANHVVLSLPDNRGKGIMWWEPATMGGLRDRGYFDDDGNALPVLDAFHEFTHPVSRTDGN